MRIIEPYRVTPAMMVASNIPENDHGAWASGTTYASGARVIFDHGVWESVQSGNVGHSPSLDAGEWWVRLGATNRWRAFDERLGGLTTGGASITYSIGLPRTLNALCFFGLGASSLRVRVVTPGAAVIYDRTIALATREQVGNAWEYAFTPFTLRTDVVITDMPMPAGATLEIEINAGAAAQVGEIFIGNDIQIGETLIDTSLGIVDYSKKDRDEWGGVFIVPRPVTETVNFRFAVQTTGARRVQEIMKRITTKVCVFYAVEGDDPFGTTVAGILRSYDLTLGANISYGTIDAESLA